MGAPEKHWSAGVEHTWEPTDHSQAERGQYVPGANQSRDLSEARITSITGQAREPERQHDLLSALSQGPNYADGVSSVHQGSAKRGLATIDWPFVTTHGRGSFSSLMGRHTIEERIRQTAHPILLTKSTPKEAYTRILVPVDFSRASIAAIRAVMAGSSRAQVIFLTAFTLFDDTTRHTRPPRGKPIPTLTAASERARARLAQFIGEHDGRDNLVSIVAQHGSLDAMTCSYAARMRADLVVAGRQPVSRWETLFLGSAAWNLCREIEGDVLVVPDSFA